MNGAYNINIKNTYGHRNRAYNIGIKELSATDEERMMVMNEERMQVSGENWARFAGPHFHEKSAYAGASERYPPLPHFTGFVNIVHKISTKFTYKS